MKDCYLYDNYKNNDIINEINEITAIEKISMLLNTDKYNYVKKSLINNFYKIVILKNPTLVYFIIYHVLTKQLKNTTKIKNTTNYDILLTTKSIGFTGTPWITLPNQLQK